MENLRHSLMLDTKKKAQMRKLSDKCLAFHGVKAVTWWEGHREGGVTGITIVLTHSWWSWGGLRKRNRHKATHMVLAVWSRPWAFVEVI